MRRLHLALFALLLPLAALAKWDVFSVPGSGQAAWISDAGDYAVATTAGAYRLLADGGISERIEVDGGSTAMVDALIDGRGCLMAVPKRSQQIYVLYADPSCGPTTIGAAISIAPDTPVRMRRAHGGAVVLSATDPGNVESLYFFAPDGTPANGFAQVTGSTGPLDPSNALGVLRSGGADVAFAGVNFPSAPIARIVDGGAPAFLSIPSASSPLELAVVDPTTTLLTTSSGQLVRASGLGSATPTWTPLTVGDLVHAVGFAPETDEEHVGIGMAGSTTAGPVAFQFAVPLANAPGQSWAPNPQVPSYSGVAQSADCTGDGICIAATDATDTSNVVLYTNASKPSWAPPSLIVTDAGTVVPIDVAPTDLDGDPLAVTWSAPTPLTVQTADAQGFNASVSVPGSATGCDQPFIDYAVTGALTDGLAAHRDTRTVTVRVQRVFSPLSAATADLDAGYAPTSAALVGTVDVTGANCPIQRGLRADVTATPNGGTPRTAHLSSLPAGFAFPRTSCLAETDTVSATLIDGDGGVGPSASTQVTVPAQPAGLDSVTGGPLVATCGQGAHGTLTAVASTGACAAQTISWAQEGGPPLVVSNGSGGQFEIATSDLGLQELIGRQLDLRLTADSGGNTASLVAHVPIVVDPFIQTRTELETPAPRTDAPLGVRVTVENPTACPISDATLDQAVEDAELVPGSARIDGRAVDATVSKGTLTVKGLSLAPGERHQVTFDLRPHVLGAPAPKAQVALRGVPISQETALAPLPTSAGCSCQTGSTGPDVFVLLLVAVALIQNQRRHATRRRSVRKSL